MASRATTPLVSVLTPVWNATRFVGDAIRSIQAQDLAAWEMILVDDGSTDDSAERIRALSERDPRVRLLRGAHGGVSKARNLALEAAGGEYVANLDADDLARPGRLRAQVDFLRAHPECVAVGTHLRFVDASGWPIRPSRHPTDHAGILAELHQGRGLALCHSSAMFRREALERVDPYDEALRRGEDLDLYLRLASLGELRNLPEILLDVRRHFSLSFDEAHEDDRQQRRELIERAYAKLGRTPPPLDIQVRTPPMTRGQWHAATTSAALDAGHRGTALKHSLLAVADAPLTQSSWLAVGASLLGRRVSRALIQNVPGLARRAERVARPSAEE